MVTKRQTHAPKSLSLSKLSHFCVSKSIHTISVRSHDEFFPFLGVGHESSGHEFTLIDAADAP